ncbi:hypothetical protein A7E78_02530 [Syntrophotalea acetylenivorans]|uniref:Uncharacterized protein n=1 Tax=Syntrophotalea acetylenivorans TaxID=1842532 RepID=A0A1L3GLL9_9BACT|nr:outer membrane beta-barrel protein [Syntrophotalea acetylenivorans]APG26822.1 hypothetical protein A7E78_02530 [Syntrophotalea acetylenivorans]
MKKCWCLLAILVLGLLTTPVWAAAGGWKCEIAPYMWGVGIDGDITVKGTKVEVDVGVEDLIDKVDFAGGLLAVVQKGRWVNWLQVDYFEISDDENVGKIEGSKVEVESDTLLLTVATGIQVDGWKKGMTFDILGGLRYTRMDNELTISGNASASGSRKTDIYDGVLVVRPSFQLSKRWRFNPTLSVGAGDSDLTYELQPQFQFHFNDTWIARLGYRRLYYDTEGSSGNKFDAAFHGFILGLGGTF